MSPRGVFVCWGLDPNTHLPGQSGGGLFRLSAGDLLPRNPDTSSLLEDRAPLRATHPNLIMPGLRGGLVLYFPGSLDVVHFICLLAISWLMCDSKCDSS